MKKNILITFFLISPLIIIGLYFIYWGNNEKESEKNYIPVNQAEVELKRKCAIDAEVKFEKEIDGKSSKIITKHIYVFNKNLNSCFLEIKYFSFSDDGKRYRRSVIEDVYTNQVVAEWWTTDGEDNLKIGLKELDAKEEYVGKYIYYMDSTADLFEEL
jgi:hypothetical protein